MPMRRSTVIIATDSSVNRDLEAFVAEFNEDARWHGPGRQVQGRKVIGAMVGQLIDASGGTLQIDLHDVLANDEHAVVPQITRAERAGRVLEDRVVYVFHLHN